MSPEAITTGAHAGPPTDIWSMAALVVEMCTTQPPFADVEPMAALFKIGQQDTDFTQVIPTGASRACQKFLLRCFQRIPERRPRAQELLKDPFFHP
jgi:serine/threonine protein kinase